MSLKSDLIRLAHEKPEFRRHLLPLIKKAVSESERVAEWSKKFHQLTYWTSRNTTTSVNCETLQKAKAIIKNTGVKQTLKKV